MTTPSPDALLLALCAKHEELREPCRCLKNQGVLACRSRYVPELVRGSEEYEAVFLRTCSESCSCHGAGYTPLTGPALLAGLLEVAKDMKLNVLLFQGVGGDCEAEVYPDGYVGYELVKRTYYGNGERNAALTLALARADGLTGGHTTW